MPSVTNSPSSEAITDGMANMVLKKISYPIGSKITAKLNTGAVMKGEIVAYDPEYKVVIMSKFVYSFILKTQFLLHF